jgi:hypothetical protein
MGRSPSLGCGDYHQPKERTMTLCPIALAVGCQKCFAFSVCPVKTVIGDYREVPKSTPKASSAKASARKKPGKSR